MRAPLFKQNQTLLMQSGFVGIWDVIVSGELLCYR